MAGYSKSKLGYNKKIGPRREGPFEIKEVLGPVTYRLKLPSTWKIHNVFHAVLLRQYKETDVYGANFLTPPPEILDGEEVYKVESIMRHRKRGRGIQYYVKWKGYPISEASWEPENIFSNDGNMLAEYKNKHGL